MISSMPSSAAADKENVRRIDLQELLLRMLASALRGHGCGRPFQNLQERLLNPFSRDITGDGGILRLARNLIDLINVDDAALCFFNIIVCRLDQLEQNVLHVFADVAGFRE